MVSSDYLDALSVLVVTGSTVVSLTFGFRTRGTGHRRPSAFSASGAYFPHLYVSTLTRKHLTSYVGYTEVGHAARS
jgi:hypothetical protein